MRGQDEKINILIDSQIRNEERFAESGKRFAALAEAQAAAYSDLAQSQAETDARLRSLIATVDRVLGSRDNGGA